MATIPHLHPWAALLALGSLSACESGDSSGSGGTAENGSTTGSGPVTTTGSQSGPGSTTTTGQGSTTGAGGSSFACDPPAEPGSLYELAATSWDITISEPVSMCEYRDQVLLIVNTAAI
ncbi:MAG: hypothetical protein JNL21_28710 [Myxococcales bacterium]|nr:hypothetical protein [Myxococcales bacterium]